MTTELVAELERRAARFAAVATVQQAISATISLNEAYREIYKAVASVVDAPCFALMIADPLYEKFNAHCIIVDSEEREGESVLDFPNGTETITRVFQTGLPIVSSKPERWWQGTIFQVASKREVKSEITAPLTYRDRTVGVMQVLSYRTNAYDGHDLDLIMLIARQAAVAIENARLFDAQRSEQRQTEAAAEIARVALRKVTVAKASHNILADSRRRRPIERKGDRHHLPRWNHHVLCRRPRHVRANGRHHGSGREQRGSCRLGNGGANLRRESP